MICHLFLAAGLAKHVAHSLVVEKVMGSIIRLNHIIPNDVPKIVPTAVLSDAQH